MKPATCFPLSWPPGHARTADRKRSQFGADHAGDVSLPAARAFVIDELTKLGATAIIVTTNVPTTRAEAQGALGALRSAAAARSPSGGRSAELSSDGSLEAASREERDPGVAAWFTFDGQERVIACDRWTTIAENLRAVGLTVEATRALARWGASDVVARAMEGFRALPSADRPVSAQQLRSEAATRPWRAVLGVGPGYGLAQARVNYKTLIRKAHPDMGGNARRAAEINAAMAEAERELGSRSEQRSDGCGAQSGGSP